MGRHTPAQGLSRGLGLFDAAMLVIGCIVGVGIFRTAASIAAHVSSPTLTLALWGLGGGLSLCGALCYAELAAMFPKSGGDYVYISEIYGRFWGFLFGWAKLFVERTGTIAILGFVFAEYAGRLVPPLAAELRLLAAGAVIALTAVNVIGLRWGKLVQNVFTLLKVAALGALIVAGWWSCLLGATPTLIWDLPAMDRSLVPAAGLALVFILWTYGGWTEAAYVAEEVTHPQRHVPRAILGGLLLTTVLYVMVNLAYLVCLSPEQLRKSPLVASSVMQAAWGPTGALVIAMMVACSAFGALNGYILTGGRILYAMGREHPLFARLGRVHPTFHTPAAALWLNAAIAVILISTKTFEQIMTYSTVVISVFFVMAVFGVILLRRRRPALPRPYRAAGYPLTPIVFCLTMIGFIGVVCAREPREAVFGFGLLVLGMPLYHISGRLAEYRRTPQSAQGSGFRVGGKHLIPEGEKGLYPEPRTLNPEPKL